MDRSLYTNEAAVNEATVIQTNLALSKIRLFDGTLVPDVNTTLADLEAAETTLVGYPAGGYPVATFSPPIFISGGGVIIYSVTVNVVYASGPAQVIGGYWLEDAAGDVRVVVIFDPTRSLSVVGDGFPIICQLGYGRNTVAGI